METAQRLRPSLAEVPFMILGLDPHLTCSISVCADILLGSHAECPSTVETDNKAKTSTTLQLC